MLAYFLYFIWVVRFDFFMPLLIKSRIISTYVDVIIMISS